MFYVRAGTYLWYEMSRRSGVRVCHYCFIFCCARGRISKCVIIIIVNIIYLINYYTLIIQPPTPSLSFKVEAVSFGTSHFVVNGGFIVVAIFFPPARFTDVGGREVVSTGVTVGVTVWVTAFAPLPVREIIVVGLPRTFPRTAFLLFGS